MNGNLSPHITLHAPQRVITLSEGSTRDALATSLALWTNGRSAARQCSLSLDADASLFIAGAGKPKGPEDFGGPVMLLADISLGSARHADDDAPASLAAAKAGACAGIVNPLHNLRHIVQRAILDSEGFCDGGPVHLILVHTPRGDGLLQSRFFFADVLKGLPHTHGKRFLLAETQEGAGHTLYELQTNDVLKPDLVVGATGRVTSPQAAARGNGVIDFLAAQGRRPARRQYG